MAPRPSRCPAFGNEKGGGRRSSPAARSLRGQSSTTTLRSSPAARPRYLPWGTRQRSTGRCTVRTCRCPSHSNRSRRTLRSRRPGCRHLWARRAQDPALPRERKCSSVLSLSVRMGTRIGRTTARRVRVGKPELVPLTATAARCGRRVAGHERRPIQFRQTPKRIRAGRIGTASEVARYSRLTAMPCGAGEVAHATPSGSPPSPCGNQLAFAGVKSCS